MERQHQPSAKQRKFPRSDVLREFGDGQEIEAAGGEKCGVDEPPSLSRERESRRNGPAAVSEVAPS